MMSESGHSVIYLGGGPSQTAPIQALVDSGYRVIVVDRNARCPGRRLGQGFVNASTWDADEIFTRWSNLPDDNRESVPPLVLFNSGGPVVHSAFALARRLGRPLGDDLAAGAALSKSAFRQLSNQVLALDHPFAMIDAENGGWVQACRQFPGGIIVRPDINQVGKSPCRIISNPRPEAPPILDFGMSVNGRWIVEPYLADGQDLVCLALIRRGEIVWSQVVRELNRHDAIGEPWIGAGRSITCLGFSTVTPDGGPSSAAVIKAARQLIGRLHLRMAAVAISFRWTARCLLPVELHLDPGGENIFFFPQGWSWREFFRQWLGQGADRQSSASPSHEVRWLLYADPGPLIDNRDEVDITGAAASGGRVQWRLATQGSSSKSLLERLGFDA